MATKYKLNTGVALGTNTNWSLTSATVVDAPAAAPGAGDIAYWQASSLGPSLTGSISPDGIQVDGASANITHSTGTITLGSSGFTFASTNNRSWTETGTIAVGAVNQTWSVAIIAPSTVLFINSATGLTGSSTIDIVNNTIGLDNSYAQVRVTGACTGFTGTLRLQDRTSLSVSGNSLTGANITVSGTGTKIFPISASGDILGSVAKTLIINNDLTLGFASRSFTIANDVSLGSTTKTITADGESILSGAISGTAGFTFSGDSILRVTGTGSGLTGTITVTNSAGDSRGLFINLDSGGISGANFFPNVTNMVVSTAGSSIRMTHNSGVETFPQVFSGSGTVSIVNQLGTSVTTSSSGVTFNAGALVGLTGTSSPTGSGASIWPSSGFGIAATSLNNKAVVATIYDLPVYLNYITSVNSTIVFEIIKYVGNVTSPSNAKIWIICRSADLSTYNKTFEANHSNSDPALDFSGGIERANGVSGTSIFTLSGTHTGNNTISGVISASIGTLGITKDGVGRWVLSGDNTYTGTTTITNGTLVAASAGALGTTGDIDIATGGTLEIQGGITLTKTNATPIIVGNASNPSIYVTSGDNTFTSNTITLSGIDSIIDIASGASLTTSSQFTGASRAIIKKGTGTLNLTNFGSTFSGTPVIQNGTLGVTTMANGTANSPIGTSAGVTLGLSGTTNNATLKHIGTSLSTSNKNFTFNSDANSTFTIDSSGTGTGALTLSGTITISQTGAHTLEFSGTNTDTNNISSTIPDSTATGATTVLKSGSNTWVLSGTLNNTGGFNCTAGTLNFGSTNRTLSGTLSVSGGTVVITNGNTISSIASMSGGTITAVLTGSNTLTITSGSTYASPATIQPDNASGNNSLSGNVSVNGYAYLISPNLINPSTLSQGKILGDSTVTVSSTGVLRTKIDTANSSQMGRARYKNLTFQSGGALMIG